MHPSRISRVKHLHEVEHLTIRQHKWRNLSKGRLKRKKRGRDKSSCGAYGGTPYVHDHDVFGSDPLDPGEKIQVKIEQRFTDEYELLQTRPAAKDSASVIIAEIGTNRDLFIPKIHLSP